MNEKACKSTEMLLEYYYIGGETINRSYPIFDGLDKYNMSEFHRETASIFNIDDCQYNSIGMNHTLWLAFIHVLCIPKIRDRLIMLGKIKKIMYRCAKVSLDPQESTGKKFFPKFENFSAQKNQFT